MTALRLFYASLALNTCLCALLLLTRHEPVRTGDASGAALLPLPPIPPHIAQGPAYTRCLGLVASDPPSAERFAAAWNGGDGARECRALALIAEGNIPAGATILDNLARDSAAPAIARATVFGEASQAWLIAGDATHALRSGADAAALAPGSTDLLLAHAAAAGRLGRYQAAIDDLDRAIDIDPHRADALAARATAWQRLGQTDLALDDANRALAIDAANVEALADRDALTSPAR